MPETTQANLLMSSGLSSLWQNPIEAERGRVSRTSPDDEAADSSGEDEDSDMPGVVAADGAVAPQHVRSRLGQDAAGRSADAEMEAADDATQEQVGLQRKYPGRACCNLRAPCTGLCPCTFVSKPLRRAFFPVVSCTCVHAVGTVAMSMPAFIPGRWLRSAARGIAGLQSVHSQLQDMAAKGSGPVGEALDAGGASCLAAAEAAAQPASMDADIVIVLSSDSEDAAAAAQPAPQGPSSRHPSSDDDATSAPAQTGGPPHGDKVATDGATAASGGVTDPLLKVFRQVSLAGC